MYDGQRIGVVIPAHNEGAFVGEVIDDLPEFVDRVFVVDDASTDETWAEIKRRTPDAPESQRRAALADGGTDVERRLVPIRHERNRGRGAAVKTGYRRALEAEMDAIAVIDGDGQMDPAILERFVEPVVRGQADYAKGNRLLSPEHRDGMSRWRLFGNSLLTLLTKISSGYWRMMDPQNGYTVVSASALRSIDLERLYDGYGFLNDMLVHLNVADVTVVDVGMRARYGEEESGIRYSRFVPRLSGLLLRDFLWRLRIKYLLFDFHPLVGLYVLGVVAAIGGAGFLGYALLSNLTPIRALLSLLVFVLSGTLVTFAMIFDRANNSGLEGRVDDGLREGSG